MARHRKRWDAQKGLASNIRDLLYGRTIHGSVRSYSPDIQRHRARQPRPIYLREFYTVYDVNYTVRTCVDALASDISKEGHYWERVNDYPLTPDQEDLRRRADALITNPNPECTEHDLLEGITKDLLIGADAYLEVVYDTLKAPDGHTIGKRPRELWNVDGATMFIRPMDQTGQLPPPPHPAYEQEISASSPVQFASDEIIHVSEGNISGRLYGTPRLLSAVLLVGTMHKALYYNWMTFKGQKYPKSLLSVGELVQDGDLDRIIAKMDRQAEENPNGIAVIDSPALQLLKLIDSNRDMEFMDLVRFIERSICAVFRVPPIRIGIAETGGAGIVVGHTQMQTYWDNVEELQRQIGEALSHYFRDHLGLKAYILRIKSARPPLYNEQAIVEDLRIKNGSLTINEARQEHGLDPVAWGNEPPPTATGAPAFSLDASDKDQEGAYQAGVVLWPQRAKAVKGDRPTGDAPGRMENSRLVGADVDAVMNETRSALAGSWERARRAMLDALADYDAITKSHKVKKAEGRRVVTVDELQSILDGIMADWEAEADAILADGNASAYTDGRLRMAEDLGVQDVIQPFSKADAERLQGIQRELAATPIRTFRGEQRRLIVDAVTEAHAEGRVDTYEIRNAIEDKFRQFTDEETWKLDRIVRTSIHQANSEARLGAMEDSGVQEVRFITANDGRVRPTHLQYHNEVIPLDLARDLLRDINCRCRAVKPARRPDTVPSPEDVAAAIQGVAADATAAARASLEAI